MKHVLTWPLLAIILFYQYVISPFLSKRCRFFPTCSSYAYDAIKYFGSGYGMILTIKRLIKCHPFHEGGFDPVPLCKDKNQ